MIYVTLNAKSQNETKMELIVNVPLDVLMSGSTIIYVTSHVKSQNVNKMAAIVMSVPPAVS